MNQTGIPCTPIHSEYHLVQIKMMATNLATSSNMHLLSSNYSYVLFSHASIWWLMLFVRLLTWVHTYNVTEGAANPLINADFPNFMHWPREDTGCLPGQTAAPICSGSYWVWGTFVLPCKEGLTPATYHSSWNVVTSITSHFIFLLINKLFQMTWMLYNLTDVHVFN